jgi:hypothetical protein
MLWPELLKEAICCQRRRFRAKSYKIQNDQYLILMEKHILSFSHHPGPAEKKQGPDCQGV